jgi:hypothetical protein
MTDQIEKKRSSKLYYKASGKMATYKCISKCFDVERVIDYLALGECKMRIQTVVAMIATQERLVQ